MGPRKAKSSRYRRSRKRAETAGYEAAREGMGWAERRAQEDEAVQARREE